MILSAKFNFIFVKTRKTAGSTVEKLLYDHLGKGDVCTGSERDSTPALNIESGTNGHLGCEQIRAIVGSDFFENAIKVTIERNPWDKVVSSYFWHKKIKPQIFSDMAFEEYVTTCPLIPFDEPMWSSDKIILVDKIFQQENLPELFSFFRDRYGINIDQDIVEATRCKSGIRLVKDYRDMHTKKTRKFIENKFAFSIEKLGYEY